MRSIASSLQELARATVQINNRLVDLNKLLKEKESDGQEDGGDALPGL
jgi:hypothetical protein